MALSRLGNDPGRLFQAIEHFERTRLNLTPATVREAVEEFQRIRAAKVSPATLDDDRWRLLQLVKAFERCQMSELTDANLRKFFDGLKGNPRSIYKSVRVFFGWAKDYGYIAINPMLGITPVGEFGVRKEIYSTHTFARMLGIAAGLEPPRAGQEVTHDFIALLPWFALSGFCGLRSCEAFRLNRGADAIRWSDLYFDRGFIEIREGVAKATRRSSDARHIETPHYLAAAQAWLSLVPRDSETIVPWSERTMVVLKREFAKRTGIKFVQNGLRNSFASYALTYDGLVGVGKLALEMGNSEGVCKRFYVRTLEPRSGQAWFNLRPTPINVIPMEMEAA
jgi:hypothetical protein